jgi:hypothetical protein
VKVAPAVERELDADPRVQLLEGRRAIRWYVPGDEQDRFHPSACA